MALASHGCGGPPPAAPPEPLAASAPARPLTTYRELGFLTGPATFPVVGRWAMVAGPADSTLLLLGLSLPTSALRFQREATGFAAEYVVAVRVARDDDVVRLIDRRETVRVPAFDETTRTDEAVVFQTAVRVAPGRYVVTVRARDGLSARGMDAVDTVTVPAHGAAARALPAPLVVHEAGRRTSRADEPDLTLNPRHTVTYGGAPALAYVELHGGAGGARLVLEDEHGAEHWAAPVEAEGDEVLASAVVALPTDALPPGRFRLAVERDAARSEAVPLMVALSDRWIVANFEEVTELLRHIAAPAELAALAGAAAAGRQERWADFWARRDPDPAAPGNPYRDAFFERVRTAAERFAEPARPGWRTDRGEVYIVLGPPSRASEGVAARRGAGPRRLEWYWEEGPLAGLALTFIDRSGLGTWELTAGSRSAFRTAARRLRSGEP